MRLRIGVVVAVYAQRKVINHRDTESQRWEVVLWEGFVVCGENFGFYVCGRGIGCGCARAVGRSWERGRAADEYR